MIEIIIFFGFTILDIIMFLLKIPILRIIFGIASIAIAPTILNPSYSFNPIQSIILVILGVLLLISVFVSVRE